jgi:Fe-S-cluster containining protein
MPKSQSSPAGRARRPRRKSEPAKPPNGHANGHGPGSPRRLPIVAAQATERQQVSCLNCGLCCSYIAVEIDEPTTVKAATDVLWYLYHQNICIYAEGEEWMVQFEARCQHYQDDHKCAIYETRPKICRDYDETNCEINAEEVGHVFYTPGEFLAYLEQHYKRIHTLVKKRYLPPNETLNGRQIGRKRVGPFKPRYEGLRALASRPPG